jgi:methylisocitrate lyase
VHLPYWTAIPADYQPRDGQKSNSTLQNCSVLSLTRPNFGGFLPRNDPPPLFDRYRQHLRWIDAGRLIGVEIHCLNGGTTSREMATRRFYSLLPSTMTVPKKNVGERFREALAVERPLQIVGTINAFSALLAREAGFRAIYLSGAGVANSSFGLPDLGMTTLSDVCEDVRRITSTVELPLLVDADTGWGNAFNISRAVRDLARSGAAGCHLEDQIAAKRCGHRPNKEIVSADEMADRIKAAVDSRPDPSFVIMARTDSIAQEGIPSAIARCERYVEAGADMVFAEAVTRLEDYQEFARRITVPILANLTEFGRTPLFSLGALREAGVAMVLYPLSAFRAMAAAAERVYQTIRETGSQGEVISTMQTRDRLYDVLDYHRYERKLDELFGSNS